MEQNLEPQRPRIGTEEVRRAADILRRYHAGKRQLEQRIIDNEQFWKLRHWEQMEPWTAIRSPRCCPGSRETGRRPES